MKQTKLRRRRVIRYSILYFVMLVVFVALIIGPALAGKYVPNSAYSFFSGNLAALVQPIDKSNNDTRGTLQTGTAVGASSAPTQTAGAGRLLLLY
jgi:1,3-beta-glucan synthase